MQANSKWPKTLIIDFLWSTLSCQLFIINSLLSTLYCRLLLSALYYRLLIVDSYCRLLIVDSLLSTPIVDSSLFIIDSLWFTLHYLLSIVYSYCQKFWDLKIFNQQEASTIYELTIKVNDIKVNNKESTVKVHNKSRQ